MVIGSVWFLLIFFSIVYNWSFDISGLLVKSLQALRVRYCLRLFEPHFCKNFVKIDDECLEDIEQGAVIARRVVLVVKSILGVHKNQRIDRVFLLLTIFAKF